MKNRFSKTATSIWQKTALVLLGLIVSLVLLEVGMRFGGFVLLSIQEYGNLRSIKQKGAYRILCLGESTTQGTYPKPLEQALNRRNIGVRFSVIDRGRGAKTTTTLLEEIEPNLTEYHPDMVVTMMGINDRGEHIPFEAATVSKGAPFIRSLRTYYLARLLWLHILTKAKEMGFYKPDKDRRSSGTARTSVPETGLKETSDKDISAEGSLKKAIEINPNNDKVFAELGFFYTDQAKLTRAVDAFKKAIELNPNNDHAYVGLGWVYQEQNKLIQAEDFFQKAAKLNPKNHTAYFGLGALYPEPDKLPQAEEFFKKALELDPGNDHINFALGRVCRDQGKFPQAEGFYRKAIELNPRNDFALLDLGGLYREQGKFSEAEDLFKKAIGINLERANERILRALASLYEETGKPGLAKEYAEKVNRLRAEYYGPHTANNYRKLKEILDRHGIRLVCAQYPMRNVELLQKIFKKDQGVIFVDNETVFKEAVKKGGYKEYFRDMFAGDFGHCTPKGNELLAQNIAGVILRKVFNKQ